MVVPGVGYYIKVDYIINYILDYIVDYIVNDKLYAIQDDRLNIELQNRLYNKLYCRFDNLLYNKL